MGNGPMGTGAPFPGGKARSGRDADHSPPSSSRLRMSRSYTSSPPRAPSWRVAGHLYLYLASQQSYITIQVSRLTAECFLCFTRDT
jgi:hypothetical protein